jgi:filamentous hemagglutinin family protein
MNHPVVLAAIAVTLTCAVCQAGQVHLDGTVGAQGPITGPDFAIPDTVGRKVGNNLFHSFSRFDLDSGESATFTGPDNIRNIISRVTGGSPSRIDGTLRSDIAGANFFFINPFGVIFGRNAKVEVSGSFAVTTADYVKLADGGRFDARNPGNDILTTAPVSAFGFLGATSAPIAFEGPGEGFNYSTLDFPAGKSVYLIGSDIKISNFRFNVPSGRVALIAVDSAGEVTADVEDMTTPFDTSGFSKLGNVDVGGATVDDLSGFVLSGDPASGLDAIGKNITFRNVFIIAENYDVADALSLNLWASESISIGPNINIESVLLGEGKGTDMNMTAPVIRFLGRDESGYGDGTSIFSASFGLGSSGDLRITADQFYMYDAAQFTTTAGDVGPAGTIYITAREIVLDGGPNGSSVEINAQTEYGGGTAGQVVINAETLTLQRQGLISSISYGDAPAGTVSITADLLRIEGMGEEPASYITGIKVDNGEAADFLGAGGGGNIFLQLGRLEMTQGGSVQAISYSPTADAGNIEISADKVRMESGSIINAYSNGTGSGGNVTLTLRNNLRMESGSLINVLSLEGNAGNVTVSAGRAITIINSSITGQAAESGGNLQLMAPQLVYLRNSRITAEALSGDGGNVLIDPLFAVFNQSQVIASAVFGNGGNIKIVADNFLQSSGVFDASSQFGLQGTVAIVAPSLDLAADLVILDSEYLHAENQLQPHCSIRLPVGISSFVTRGRGGVPAEPTGLLPISPRDLRR